MDAVVAEEPRKHYKAVQAFESAVEHLGFLLAATAATALFATWCLRSYQRSL